MSASTVNLQKLLESLQAHIEVLNEGIEPHFLRTVANFELSRQKWVRVEQELAACKEVLAKSETERGALEVKLKHARNQVDVEIRRRQRAEADYEKLDHQMQLIRDILVSECASNSIQLNEEQRSALAFLNNRSQVSHYNPNTSRRLSTIDESASILSDISYDKTDDSLDWDSSVLRTVKLKKRQKRRSSRTHTDGPASAVKKSRATLQTSEMGDESIIAKTTVLVPANGDPVEAVSTIEAVPYWTRSRSRSARESRGTDAFQPQPENEPPVKPARKPAVDPSSSRGNDAARQHDFVTKTVIKPESCLPCGHRIKFGKLCLKCRDCRVVAHPECRNRCALPCVPCPNGTPVRIGEGSLEDYVSASHPMIPSLVVHCVNEIEQRGLHEPGLYRVCGVERAVRELKERFLNTRAVPTLSKVEDVHVICSLLKDFFRSLKEPLLTFRLNHTFMDVAELDDDNSIAMMYQTISDLPSANRDTLAFLILHLQRVSQSEDTRMDVSNLARVFGPTIVGHAVPDPGPMTILQDTRRQPKVVERLLSLPVEYWSQFMVERSLTHRDDMETGNCYSTPEQKVSMLGPLTTPEQKMSKTPSSSSLSQRMKSALSRTTPKFGSKCSSSAVTFGRPGNFFASPLLR
ncbi:hypothetical protein GJAV_G00177840 [Gymnothorax javanicus]|nr:hypothetical protein GJAV_G00177840 [Gymnothorax javanicus]